MTTTIRKVTDRDLSIEDQAQLISALKAWQAEGVANPHIPTGDIDGDGHPDAYALDTFGRLVYVTEVPLANTVFEATGGGPETAEVS